MWQYNNAEELYHYGVLGMKWGQRRARKAEQRRAKAAAKVEYLQKKAASKVEYLQKTKPNSAALTKAKIKQTKIKNSRYGQTNGQILCEGALHNLGISAVTSIASKSASKLGKASTAEAIEVIGGLTAWADIGRTAYKLGTNYKPEKK